MSVSLIVLFEITFLHVYSSATCFGTIIFLAFMSATVSFISFTSYHRSHPHLPHGGVCVFTADEALDFERATNAAIIVVSCTRKSNAFPKPSKKKERYKQFDIISVYVRRIHVLSMTIRRLDWTRFSHCRYSIILPVTTNTENELSTMVYSGCTPTIPGVRCTCVVAHLWNVSLFVPKWNLHAFRKVLLAIDSR